MILSFGKFFLGYVMSSVSYKVKERDKRILFSGISYNFLTKTSCYLILLLCFHYRKK